MSETDGLTLVLVEAFVFGIFAGLVVVVVSYAIEKFGGTVGGVLATTPTTICAAAAGFALQGADLDESLFMVPMGMLLSVSFLYMWKMLPGYFACLPFIYQLLTLLSVCILFWLCCATIVALSVEYLLEHTSVRVEVVGLSFTAIIAVFGLVTVIFQPAPDPKASSSVSALMYFVRSLAAAFAIFLSVVLAHYWPTVGGIASTFPAIFCTTCAFLTYSHGWEMSVGSVGPMMMGSLSVPCFAMTFAKLYPLILSVVEQVIISIVVSVAVAWLISVCAVSFTVYLFLSYLKRRRSFTMVEENPDVEMEVPVKNIELREEVIEEVTDPADLKKAESVPEIEQKENDLNGV